MAHPILRPLALALPVIVVLAVATAPVAANAGSPPAVRTPSGAPIVRDVLAEHRGYSRWHLTLVDPIFMVPQGYAPPDLVPVGRAGIAGSGYVRGLAIADLAAMDKAARSAGVRLRVVSAYRSFTTQRATFNKWVQQSGYASAVRYSARAGHSEHQLGTTLDLGFVGGLDPWSYADFATTRAGAWLKANAWKFGWVMTYPKGAERQTGYIYEPWHYRYFGRGLAAQHRQSGLVPRYWLWGRG